MRNWEQAWLAYQPNEDYRDKNIFRSYYTKEYGNCCKRAEEEISIASKALFGTESEKVSEKEEAGIVLEKNPGLSTGAQEKKEFYTGLSAFFSWLLQVKASVVWKSERSRKILCGC